MGGSTIVKRFAVPAAVLSIGVCLGVMLGDGLGVRTAGAQQQSGESPFNATEQRKQIIEQLKQVNDRLAKVETKLNTGISVKVTEMPAVTVKETPK